MSGSTFSGLEIGKRGMSVHQTALGVTGNNISNLNTEGYSRQRVRITQADPLYMPALNRDGAKGMLGQGPEVAEINRVFDVLHENQLLSTNDNLGYWESRDTYIKRLEDIYAEPNEAGSIRVAMDNFWSSWQDLASNPENLSSRTVVAQNGAALAEAINLRFTRLDEQRILANDEIKATVEEINQKATEIASLNASISSAKALGDEPNDLMDKRDLAVAKLSKIVPLTVNHADRDEFQVHVDGRVLVQGDRTTKLIASEDLDNEGNIKVDWATKDLTDDPYIAKTGKLASLIEVRDNDITTEIKKIDSLAVSYADMVNDLHRSGAGLNEETGLDFFVQEPIIENVNGNYDANRDGQDDSSYLFRMTGVNSVKPADSIGLDGTIILSGANGNIEIPYTADDTVEAVISRINYSGAEVSARIDSNGKIALKGTMSQNPDNPDFVIRHVEDTGSFLTGYAGLLNASGADGAYQSNQINATTALRLDQGVNYAISPLRHPSAWLAVNENIKGDLNNIAAAKVNLSGEAAVGDNLLAIGIADLRHEKVMIDRLTSMDDFFADSASIIGSKGMESGNSLSAFTSIQANLQDVKESISGVNINEEFADMIKFQHGFAANAKFISTMDSMLDTIINRLKI